MKRSTILCFLFFAGHSLFAQTILPADVQIKTALLAAPPDQRQNETVLGYDQSGKLVTLQKGTGNLVCLCDDPKEKGIKVACYSVKLEPFMARGRELIAAGKTEAEKHEIRKQEVESGKLKMPDVPSFLYVLTGTEENYNKTTGDLKDGNFRYVIYMPYATAESTGLPTKPFVPGMPWLMDAGTYGAHVMITPPKK
jgi:hypothetical protein